MARQLQEPAEAALPARDVEREQRYLDVLYDRLDELRRTAQDRLARELRQVGGTPQARSQRDSAITMYADQVDRYSSVEHGLCFGRLDLADGERRYVGRIGIVDRDGEADPLLIDWRAPAARPFYLATAANPIGVRRRRHIRTHARTIVALDDEVLDLAGDVDHGRGRMPLTGEVALLAALDAARTGRMADIVETIQAEQDAVIRADLRGVLVIQGGPGTGKTAVALHRAAYLLYTHRDQLASRGVLVVGPNPTFLRYISHVLPALAETGVLLRTPGQLYPGVDAVATEPAATAEVKGTVEMVDVLAEAVRDRQRVPDEPIEVDIEGDPVVLDPATCAAARDRVRRTGRPHNEARALFDVEIVHALARQVAERIGADPLGGENLLDEADLAEIRRELRREPAVRRLLDTLWPVLTPQRLLTDLFADPRRVERATPGWPGDRRRLLLRPAGAGWTPADVPLLDEAAELLGDPPPPAGTATWPADQDRERLEYAEGVLEIAAGSRSIDVEDEDDPEILSVTDLLAADRLAQRQEHREHLTTAQRAARDRGWAFGHVIVDEAQELSPLAWRMLMRRCPSRSMTVVGDTAQTGALAGASSWAQVLRPYVADRWRMAELTVCYRTPSEVMDVAADVLARIDPTLRPPRAVRSTGVAPWDVTVPVDSLADNLVAAVRRETATLGEGRLAVIAPAGLAPGLRGTLARGLPSVATDDETDLRRAVVVLTVAQAKGLEFDTVLVVEPDGIVAESRRGLNDLYVALTRATQRLGVLRTGPASSG